MRPNLFSGKVKSDLTAVRQAARIGLALAREEPFMQIALAGVKTIMRRQGFEDGHSPALTADRVEIADPVPADEWASGMRRILSSRRHGLDGTLYLVGWPIRADTRTAATVSADANSWERDKDLVRAARRFGTHHRTEGEDPGACAQRTDNPAGRPGSTKVITMSSVRAPGGIREPRPAASTTRSVVSIDSVPVFRFTTPARMTRCTPDIRRWSGHGSRSPASLSFLVFYNFSVAHEPSDCTRARLGQLPGSCPWPVVGAGAAGG